MDHHGALVGWTHHDAGDRIMLRLESVRTVEAAKDREPDLMRVAMTKQQAAVLGTYLLKISGATPPPKRRGWLARRLSG